jgi:hypothetical protein
MKKKSVRLVDVPKGETVTLRDCHGHVTCWDVVRVVRHTSKGVGCSCGLLSQYSVFPDDTPAYSLPAKCKIALLPYETWLAMRYMDA